MDEWAVVYGYLSEIRVAADRMTKADAHTLARELHEANPDCEYIAVQVQQLERHK